MLLINQTTEAKRKINLFEMIGFSYRNRFYHIFVECCVSNSYSVCQCCIVKQRWDFGMRLFTSEIFATIHTLNVYNLCILKDVVEQKDAEKLYEAVKMLYPNIIYIFINEYTETLLDMNVNQTEIRFIFVQFQPKYAQNCFEFWCFLIECSSLNFLW